MNKISPIQIQGVKDREYNDDEAKQPDMGGYISEKLEAKFQ